MAPFSSVPMEPQLQSKSADAECGGGDDDRGAGCSNCDNLGNLRRDYRRAVSCLLDCEAVIERFRLDLADKDDRIARLEERLVEMSLELAKSKTLEDEHRQLLKRKPSSEGSVGDGGGGCSRCLGDESRSTPPDLTEAEAEERAEAQAGAGSIVRSASRPRHRPALERRRSNLSQSWTARKPQSPVSSKVAVDAESAPGPMSAEEIMKAVSEELTEANAEASGDSLVRYKRQNSDNCVSDRAVSSNDIFARFSQTARHHRSNSITLAPGHQTMPTRASRRSSAGAATTGRSSGLLGAAGLRRMSSRRGSALSASATSRNPSPEGLDSSFSRRINRIGSLLGMNKPIEIDDKIDLDDKVDLDVEEGERRSHRQQRRDSRSAISGVVFPISSYDCLQGLVADEQSQVGEGRGESANQEWLEF